MATIEFRGIMIFRINGNNQVAEVVMPDTRKNPPGKHHDDIFGPQHHDGRKAVRHHAGVLHCFGNKQEKDYGIDDRVVSFKDKAELLPATSIGWIADLNKLGKAEALAFDPSAPRIATIDLSLPPGFTIETEKPKTEFKFNGSVVHLFVRLKWPGTVTLQGTEEGDVVIGDNERAYIYHFDERKPKEDELKAEQKVDTGKPVVDHDFKWLYANMKWRNGHIGNWVDDVDPIGGFPAPLYLPPQVKPAIVSVSTCFPGRMQG